MEYREESGPNSALKELTVWGGGILAHKYTLPHTLPFTFFVFIFLTIYMQNLHYARP